jgi:uncharacterized protein YjgD (DUF1641 family)
MPKTRVNCPNCRQPVIAEVEQLFDVASDPSAKQKLLSGAVNVIACQNCGYQGSLATPIVYHDPDKELLLSYMPPEMGLPRNEQERILGSLINQVINRLPQEKRKGYLLRPQSTLTMQGLVERVLEGEGITREMIQAQQQKMNLLQRLISATPDVREAIAQQEDKLIDAEFFSLISRLAEASLGAGDQRSARALAELQRSLLPITTFGRELQAQSQEYEAAINSLRELGDQLTREDLLDVVSSAPNDIRLQALVRLARPAMDYEFFQMLSQRIDRARSDGRVRLIEIREKLLELTREVDGMMEERRKAIQGVIDKIIKTPDVSTAMAENLGLVDEMFLGELDTFLAEARKQGNLERSAKIQQMIAVIQEASAPPPEVKLIEAMLEAEDEASRQALIEQNANQITPEFIDALTNVMTQLQSTGDEELSKRIQAVHRQVLRFSMKANLGK